MPMAGDEPVCALSIAKQSSPFVQHKNTLLRSLSDPLTGSGSRSGKVFLAPQGAWASVQILWIADEPSTNDSIIPGFSGGFPDPQPVGDQRDELSVGGLVVETAHVLAEGLVQRLDAPAVPGDLDGVADRTLHLA